MSMDRCELCGEPSVTWIGNTEVCRRCSDTFREEARDYLADAIIDLAEAWGISAEDAYDEIMDAGFIFWELDIDKKIEAQEQELLKKMEEGIRVNAQVMGGAPWHDARVMSRVCSLRKKGYNIGHDSDGYYLKGEGQNGLAEQTDSQAS